MSFPDTVFYVICKPLANESVNGRHQPFTRALVELLVDGKVAFPFWMSNDEAIPEANTSQVFIYGC